MNKQTLFWGGMLLFLIGVAGAIFFMIPGIPHMITSSDRHVNYALVAFAVGVLGLLAAFVNRPGSRA